MFDKIKVLVDREYYKEAYQAAVENKILLKIDYYLGFITAIGGFLLFLVELRNSMLLIPLGIMTFGLISIFWTFYRRYKWIKDRVNSKIANTVIEFTLHEEYFETNSGFGHSTLSWNSIQSVKETKKGLILRPESGVMIYLPDSSFSSLETKNFIIKKIKTEPNTV
jgi:hypothetical protein